MKFTIGGKIGSAFALCMILLTVLGVVSYLNTRHLIAASDAVGTTHDVLATLQTMLGVMTDAETGMRGFVITGDNTFLAPYDGARAKADASLLELRAMARDDVTLAGLDTLGPLVEQRLDMLDAYVGVRRERGFEAAQERIASGTGKDAMDSVRRVVAELTGVQLRLRAERLADSKAQADRTVLMILVGVPLALIGLAAIALLLVRAISVPLRIMAGLSDRVATGDLTTNIPQTGRRDEIGMLQQSLRRMSENLRDLLRQTKEGIGMLGTSAAEVMATAVQIASGAAETATGVTETTTAVEEVKQTALISSQKAKAVLEGAQRSVQISQAGRKSVEETLAGMGGIRTQMESIALSIVRLSDQSQAIGEIIATVNDIAEQSNLLAVNAAIEAAKAGEQGKGFAVVAQEVKSLAEQSKQATAQVRGILGDVQKATSAAVMATEQGGKVVEAAVKQSTAVIETIRQLGESIAQAAQASTQIAASSQEQVVGMDQVAQAMESIKVASAQNVLGTRQAEAAAQQLQGLAMRLGQLVAQYRLEERGDVRAG